MGRDPNAGLPPFALEHLRTAPSSSRRIVRIFHYWLKRTGRSILQLQANEIDKFLEPLHVTVKTPAHRRRLFHYFDWLHTRKLLSFDPRSLSRSDIELPPQAIRFTKQLEPTHKPSTVGGYRTHLRQFHLWLDSQTLTVDSIDRDHISTWLQWLHARNLSAAHRVHVIIVIRAYFLWLEEQPEYTGRCADYLFRRGDLPKRPQYLPRPIPADLDRVLQRRLRKSRSLPQLGLLLMRRTGLRIGELRALPYHCVQTDHRDNSFLKVPLGKLNNERLVPLDRATLRLIEKLRIVGSTGKRGKRRTLLLESASGKSISYKDYRDALERACRGLVFAEPMTSHRLRHTYATSMLVAGVTIPVLMKLLGHRDYKMTLRYAAITIETVAAEYADAIETIEQRYNLKAVADTTFSPTTALSDLARYLTKHVDDSGLDKQQARSLTRRLHRMNTAVQRLLRECARHSKMV